jgi:hypothetical protein
MASGNRRHRDPREPPPRRRLAAGEAAQEPEDRGGVHEAEVMREGDRLPLPDRARTPDCPAASTAKTGDVKASRSDARKASTPNHGDSQRSALCEISESRICTLAAGTLPSRRSRNCTAPAITRALRANSSIAVSDPASRATARGSSTTR